MLQIITVNHKNAFCVARVLLTVSYDTVCVVSGIMPIQLVAEYQIRINRLLFEDWDTHLGTATREARPAIVAYINKRSVDPSYRP